MHRLRQVALTTAACVLVPAVAACSAGGTGTGSGTGSGTNANGNAIRVLWQPSGASSYFYANTKGLWSKHNLKLKPIKMTTGQQEIAALVGGSADIAFMGGPPTVTALGRKVGIKIIFSTNDASQLEGLYANPKSKIKSIQDMAGKRIGVAKGSSADAGIHLALKKAHIDASTVHLVYMKPEQMLPAYQRGDIDGVWVWDTWGARMLSAGAKLVCTEAKFGVSEPNSWVVTDSFLKAHPQQVARFVAALNEGAVGANAHPDVAAHEYSQVTGVTAAQATQIMKAEHTVTIADLQNTSTPLSFTSQNGGFAHSLGRTSKMLKTLGVLPQAPPESTIRSHIDTSVLKAAAKSGTP